jgi:heme oxygenase
MAGISFDTIRVGKKYYLRNFGDLYEFEVLERISTNNFKLKDLHTLETYQLEDLIRWGKGKDYDLRERN